MRQLQLNSRIRGLTLIEILVVVVILGILAVLIVPGILGRVEQARVVATKSDIRTIDQALQFYKMDTGSYPTAEQGLSALVTQPSTPPVPDSWKGPYVKKLPQDRWGHDYQYEIPGKHGEYDIYSYGAKGPGSGDDKGVIGNWML